MSDINDLAKPMIHSNGSSAKDLAEKYRDAGVAIEKALDAIALTAPHGRDYYLYPGDALGKALKQHRERAEKLRDVAEDFLNLFEHVDQFNHGRVNGLPFANPERN